MSKSAAKIIDETGGAAVFARKVGITPNAARVYKYRNRFPRTIWGHIVTAFPELTIEQLEEMERAA